MATDMTRSPTSHEGRIIAFPAATGTANIERCARELGRRHGADALEFWKAECRRFADQLLAAGVPESEVGQRVMQFQEDVQTELVLSHEKRAVSKSQKR
ncbi:hypothetical protein ATY77_26555 [Rhizobium sp. R634]|uniref:DUF6074 family protein n=1 Tax=Rhizobium sp. R634 TaxID=1764274 RepID=UPI000B5329CB|nr:DUF6074 family protein [Rhizobium sp. R634]OWV79556.1 hypothetical protein ATY77_26555 [Rhizobium sp. R634]